MDFKTAVSKVKGRAGWDDTCDEVCDFKRYLGKGEEDAVGHEELKHGWIFWEKKKLFIIFSSCENPNSIEICCIKL